MAALYKEQLGRVIRQHRQDLGLTQRQLADRVNIQEPQTVSRWERGENAPTDLEAVAAALETTAAELLRRLSPVAQRDRRRMEHNGTTQLDRIEAKLDEVLATLRPPVDDPLPAPPDALVQPPADSPPKSGTGQRGKRQAAAGSR